MISYIRKFAGFLYLQTCEFDKAIHEFDQAEDIDFRHVNNILLIGFEIILLFSNLILLFLKILNSCLYCNSFR